MAESTIRAPATVFLSYAREDEPAARSAFAALQRAGFRPWLDKNELRPGQDWKVEIRRAIGSADLVVVLLSSRAVRKRGFYQVEIRETLEALKQIPPGQVFVIPVRLDECHVPEELERFHFCDLFRDGEDHLLSAVTAAWADRSRDAVTLLRETLRFRQAQDISESVAEARLAEGIGEHPLFRSLRAHLDRFGALSSRLAENTHLKKASAEQFCEHFLKAISRDINALFLEAGSSNAYLAQSIATRSEHDRRLSFCTNNLLAFVDLTLKGFRVTLVPGGSPDNYYGATYGPLAYLPEQFPRQHLSAAEQSALVQLQEEISNNLGSSAFVSVSGSLMRPHESAVVDLMVGSYANRLFKRALLSMGYPIAMLVDGSKWVGPNEPDFLPAHGHQVFDKSFQFSTLLRKTPLVLVSSFSRFSDCHTFVSHFEALRYGHIRVLDEGSGIVTVAFMNDLFMQRYEVKDEASADKHTD